MTSALQTCAARIEAAIEYLEHEPDPIRAITAAIPQLRQAQISMRAAMFAPVGGRRADDHAPILTFLAGSKVPRNPWPPEAAAPAATARQLLAEAAPDLLAWMQDVMAHPGTMVTPSAIDRHIELRAKIEGGAA